MYCLLANALPTPANVVPTSNCTLYWLLAICRKVPISIVHDNRTL